MSGQSLEIFASRVEEHVREILGDGYDTEIRKVPKNNGVILTGISICRSGERVSPVIYLDDYYTERAETGISAGDTAQKIVNCYRSNGNISPTIWKSVKDLNDFEQIKNRVMFKLIHTKSNEQCLRQIPNISYLDLSIVFYLFMNEDSDGIMVAQIQNEHLTLWGVDAQTLYRAALQNMQRVMPAEIKNMKGILENPGCAYGEEVEAYESEGEPPFYVLSTASGINGAACMLYPGVLAGFAEQIGKDIIILPSSVHELLLLEDTGEMDCVALMELVKYVNIAEVPSEDILSENVYKYERSSDKVTIAA